MSKTDLKGRWALVTGGSGGIGLDLARCAAADGMSLVLVAREKDKLNEAASGLSSEFGVKVVPLAKDLARPEVPEEIHSGLFFQNIRVDILVNNAGFGLYGKFHESDLQKTLAMIDVNAGALVALTRLFLPGMIERQFGRVLNVASTAAFQGVPIEAVYGATKAFVVAFSEAITEELRGTGVGVTCLCPGPTDTDFFKRGTVRSSRFLKLAMMPSRAVAETGWRALKSGKPLVIAGLRNKMSIFSERVLPRQLVAKIARRMVE